VRVARALVSVLAIVLVSSCSDDPAPAAAPTGPAADWMVYQPGASISVIRTDGTDGAPVSTDVPGGETNPDWSPDGKRLVFAVSNGSTDDLWTVSADGSDPTLLLGCTSPCAYFDDPAWSPDGTKVLYSRMSDDGDGNIVGTLETVAVADLTVEVLLRAGPKEFFSGPRWSPDGKSAVFETVHTTSKKRDSALDGVTLTLIDMAKPRTSRRTLTDPALFAATPDWSGDGLLIVYSALPEADATSPDLFTISPDGSGLTRITTLGDDGGAAAEPAWSVDSSQVYFAMTTPDGQSAKLAVVPRTGGDPQPAIGGKYMTGNHPRLHSAN
jgi:Tol biopolymer transport system component